MDAVITYVNALDPLWQSEYIGKVGEKAIERRYRDWGTLKYLLRGIECHMPFIDNVYLVVSRESQYPDWAEPGQLRMVLHRDIIPEEYLPTFNSCTIEMFLHRINKLSQEFIYFNDDMFPVTDCKREDFFQDGKSVIGFSRHLLATGEYKKHTRNSDRQARKVSGHHFSPFFIRPQHTCSPMLKSESDKVFDASWDEIKKAIPPLRTPECFNQYLFLDYLHFTGQTVNGRISNRHLSPKVHSVNTICSAITTPATKLININDVDMEQQKFELYRDDVCRAFELHFPAKSRFEI